jgi:hypothetical protein
MSEVASDTRLCELGRQLEELWQKEQIEEASKEGSFSIEEEDRLLDEVISPEATIIHEIVRTPAATIAGLVIKARAVQWQQGIRDGFLPDGHTNAMISIVNDLLRWQADEPKRSL